ncbi:SRPBCC family protein [Intrasporangium sp. DVR]|uniref:SRPBCC family protein n=1 Tax=Intrasporangium sp. DVR TaxID=3127867 RepID=UPI0033406EC6
MRITTRRTIHRPADDVWDVVGRRFDEAGVWASSIAASRATGPATPPAQEGPAAAAPLAGAPCTARECHVAAPGAERLVEELVAYDDHGRSLTYALATGMERFARSAVSTWSVEARSDHESVVRVDAEFRLTRFGRLLAPVLAPYLSIMGRRNAADLATYVETGQPSRRKQRRSAGNPVLDRAVGLNALFSLASGGGLVLWSRWWAHEYGGVGAPVIALVGATLLAYAVLLGWLAGRGVAPRVGRVLSLLDGAWVVGTAGLLAVAGARFGPAGLGAAVATGLVVAGFGAVQWRASRTPG